MTRQLGRAVGQLFAVSVIVSAVLAAGVTRAEDGNCKDASCNGPQCPTCNGCCSLCGREKCHLVPCTVMRPVTVTETRVKNCIIHKQVEREETYTVFHQKAETREFKKEICYLDDEVKSKVIQQERCQVVENPVVQSYRVKVPVCEEQTEIVQTQECIDGQMVLVEQPCTTHVIREQEEVRTRDCVQPQVVFDKTTCTIDYCVKTPKTHTVPCAEETVYKLEPETRKRTVTACVPEIERRTYDVQVTKMYPETVCVCRHCAAKLNQKAGSSEKGGRLASTFEKIKEACQH